MTRTGAEDLASNNGIFMNSMDIRWIKDEHPCLGTQGASRLRLGCVNCQAHHALSTKRPAVPLNLALLEMRSAGRKGHSHHKQAGEAAPVLHGLHTALAAFFPHPEPGLASGNLSATKLRRFLQAFSHVIQV
ncbi:unnamed protein product [Symbiodinium sp. CCMP2592]|nr:unnamed protein product [Symbiodinium sp. CCMP2592]